MKKKKLYHSRSWSKLFLKIEKVHHREFEIQKNYFRTFLLPNIPKSIHILYFSSNTVIERWSWKIVVCKIIFTDFFYAQNLWKRSVELFASIVFLPSGTFLNIKVCHMYFQTLGTQCSNKCYLWGTNFYHCNWVTNASSSYCFG